MKLKENKFLLTIARNWSLLLFLEKDKKVEKTPTSLSKGTTKKQLAKLVERFDRYEG
jgi:hypothetical protein